MLKSISINGKKEDKSALAIMMACFNNSVSKEEISMKKEIDKHKQYKDISVGGFYTSVPQS